MSTKHQKKKNIKIPKSFGLRLYTSMLRTYLFEETLHHLFRQGQLFGGLYTGSGNEAVSVGAAMTLQSGDIIAPSHRGIGAHFVRGETFQGMLLQLMARAEGGTQGRDNAAHQGSMERGVLAMISHLAAMPALAVGCALTQKLRKTSGVTLAFIGEGGTSLGDFHEALNIASVMKLPYVLVIENNQWAYSTPPHLQYACEQLSDRAAGYGIPGETIDGTNVELVYATVARAVQRARQGKGPTLIETMTMRMRGHSAADMAEYVPKQMLQRWTKLHPVRRYEALLLRRKWMRRKDLTALTNRTQKEIDEAVSFAQSRPAPTPESCLEGVYAP